MKKINLKGVTTEAVIGVLILLLALINAVLQMFGKNVLPISNEEVSNIVSTVFLIVTVLYNTWNINDLNPDYKGESKDKQENLPPTDNI